MVGAFSAVMQESGDTDERCFSNRLAAGLLVDRCVLLARFLCGITGNGRGCVSQTNG